ncbi:MAG: efflux RND transporter permease subunit, partial [Rhodospirillales bacterium]|nr:efflux RND transporter permease subunit [Rhodospirillales bacterium]
MIRYFANHPTAANLMMVAFLVAGLFAAPQLQRETFPRIEPRYVEVTVPFPGASAEDVEEAICQRIEDSLDAVNYIEEVSCEASESVGKAKIKMVEGQNLDRFLSDIKTEVEAIDNFPDETETMIIKQLGRTDFVASVALVGPKRLVDLKAQAEAVKDRMIVWGNISEVTIQGFSDHQIRIELADLTLRQFGLSVEDVADVISRQSVDLPAGDVETRSGQILIRFDDERERVHEFANLVVLGGDQGGQVLLGDIATITDRFELDEDKIEFNGQRAALLQISKTETEDTLVAIDAVNSFIAHENAISPAGVKLVVTNDGASIVRDRLDLLLDNGAMGLLLVFLAMWIFFGLRFSFWVSMGLPVSFLGAIAVMLVTGYTINMLTMVGLLIAIGLLMDDAIVISENVARHRQHGKEPLEAAVQGAQQMFPSILASFTTTACVFGSLLFLKGDIGSILSVVPAVMLFVLSVSLVEAFLILPNHLCHAMGHHEISNPTGLRGWVENRLSWMRKHVGRAARVCVRWRYLTVGVAFGLLFLTVSLLAGGVVKFKAFPELDGDTLEVRILLPKGTPLSRTESVADHVRDALMRVDAELTPLQPDSQPLVRNVTFQFNKNVDAFESGAHVATVTADLLSAEIRNTTSDEVFQKWRQEVGVLPDVINLKFAETTIGPAGLPIDIRLQGQDLKTLKAASRELQFWLNSYEGVYDISDDLRPGKPEIRVRLRDGASTLGIDAQMVARQLRTAFLGETASEVQIGGESYDVSVRLRRDDRNSLADLDYFTVTTPEGAQVPLNVVAVLEQDRGVARINRVGGIRTVTIQGDVNVLQANANSIIQDTLKHFVPELREKYPGVSLALEGQNKEMAQTQASMVSGFALGLVGVFLLLSFQFRSY